MNIAFLGRRESILAVVGVLVAVTALVPALRAAEDVTVADPESVGMSAERSVCWAPTGLANKSRTGRIRGTRRTAGSIFWGFEVGLPI